MRAALLSIISIFALLWASSFVYHAYFVPKEVVPGFDLSGATEVPFREIAHGTQSEVSRRANYLITSIDQLHALWKMIDAPGQTPTIDFDKNDVIAVFSGSKSTSGYAIDVSAVGDAESRMVVVSLTEPGASCFVGEEVTSPYQVIELSKTALPLSHQDKQVTASCLQ